jgi:hypothetical protein
MNWAQSIRLDYIDWRLGAHGSVRRSHIQDTFGVSQAQASADLAAFEAAHPGAMQYDRNAKQYVPARNHYRARRGTGDQNFRIALTYLRKAGHPMGWG